MTSSRIHLVKGCYMPQLGNKLVLYSNGICPYSHRVHLFLNAKQIAYQTIYVDIFKKPDWFEQKSPLGRVPVLELPDKTGPIIDSLIITDYLDERYPEIKLYPCDPYRRARDKVLIHRFNAVLDTISRIMYPTGRLRAIESVNEAAEELFGDLDFFETELQKRKSIFFGGAKPNAVDYMIWPWCERMMFFPMTDTGYELDKKRFEKLINWQDQMCNDSVVKSCALPPEFYYELYQRIKAKTLTTEFMDKASNYRENLRYHVTSMYKD
ncbi:pyrimidodiazepine synthase-like [Culicoides brevitarsis]|uniref:pyrimidodiazepine synthase-like n=1 Tax=Culicoides brevitarsis TaxID=469753 RepID=UPI00307CAB95